MSFNSFEFLLFFAVVVSAYHLLPVPFKRPLLLLSSYAFYMSWAPRYGLLLLGVSLLSYVAGRGVGAGARPRAWLWAGVGGHLLVVLVFKYIPFFAETAAAASAGVGLPWRPPVLEILVPVGISFYVFQSMSYVVDVYRRQVPAERDVWAHLLYVSFFPQLVAGPIERAAALSPQLKDARRFDPARLKGGLALIGSGLFKKVVLAESLSALVSGAFFMPEARGGLSLFLGAVLARYMIFCDISGYTDMALGCGKAFGVELSPNFARPFAARNISEYWQRWHMTLSGWFRDYVFFSMAAGPFRRLGVPAMIVVAFLGLGLWHGASWNFVLWGGVNGVLMAGYLAAREKRLLPGAPDALKAAFTFLACVCLPTVLVMTRGTREALYAYGRIFGGLSDVAAWTDLRWILEGRNGVYLGTSLVFAAAVELVQKVQEKGPFLERVRRAPVPVRAGVYLCLAAAAALTLGLMVSKYRDHSEFLYFRF